MSKRGAFSGAFSQTVAPRQPARRALSTQSTGAFSARVTTKQEQPKTGARLPAKPKRQPRPPRPGRELSQVEAGNLLEALRTAAASASFQAKLHDLRKLGLGAFEKRAKVGQLLAQVWKAALRRYNFPIDERGFPEMLAAVRAHAEVAGVRVVSHQVERQLGFLPGALFGLQAAGGHSWKREEMESSLELTVRHIDEGHEVVVSVAPEDSILKVLRALANKVGRDDIVTQGELGRRQDGSFVPLPDTQAIGSRSSLLFRGACLLPRGAAPTVAGRKVLLGEAQELLERLEETMASRDVQRRMENLARAGGSWAAVAQNTIVREEWEPVLRDFGFPTTEQGYKSMKLCVKAYGFDEFIRRASHEVERLCRYELGTYFLIPPTLEELQIQAAWAEEQQEASPADEEGCPAPVVSPVAAAIGGDEVVVTVKHCHTDKQVHLSMPAQGTMLDVKHALVRKLSKGHVDEVCLVRETYQDGTFSQHRDAEEIGSARELLLLGLDLNAPRLAAHNAHSPPGATADDGDDPDGAAETELRFAMSPQPESDHGDHPLESPCAEGEAFAGSHGSAEDCTPAAGADAAAADAALPSQELQEQLPEPSPSLAHEEACQETVGLIVRVISRKTQADAGRQAVVEVPPSSTLQQALILIGNHLDFAAEKLMKFSLCRRTGADKDEIETLDLTQHLGEIREVYLRRSDGVVTGKVRNPASEADQAGGRADTEAEDPAMPTGCPTRPKETPQQIEQGESRSTPCAGLSTELYEASKEDLDQDSGHTEAVVQEERVEGRADVDSQRDVGEVELEGGVHAEDEAEEEVGMGVEEQAAGGEFGVGSVSEAHSDGEQMLSQETETGAPTATTADVARDAVVLTVPSADTGEGGEIKENNPPTVSVQKQTPEQSLEIPTHAGTETVAKTRTGTQKQKLRSQEEEADLEELHAAEIQSRREDSQSLRMFLVAEADAEAEGDLEAEAEAEDRTEKDPAQEVELESITAPVCEQEDHSSETKSLEDRGAVSAVAAEEASASFVGPLAGSVAETGVEGPECGGACGGAQSECPDQSLDRDLALDPEVVAVVESSQLAQEVLGQPLQYEVVSDERAKPEKPVVVRALPKAGARELGRLVKGWTVHGFPGMGWLRLQQPQGEQGQGERAAPPLQEFEGGELEGGWVFIGSRLTATFGELTVTARFAEALQVKWRGLGSAQASCSVEWRSALAGWVRQGVSCPDPGICEASLHRLLPGAPLKLRIVMRLRAPPSAGRACLDLRLVGAWTQETCAEPIAWDLDESPAVRLDPEGQYRGGCVDSGCWAYVGHAQDQTQREGQRQSQGRCARCGEPYQHHWSGLEDTSDLANFELGAFTVMHENLAVRAARSTKSSALGALAKGSAVSGRCEGDWLRLGPETVCALGLGQAAAWVLMNPARLGQAPGQAQAPLLLPCSADQPAQPLAPLAPGGGVSATDLVEVNFRFASCDETELLSLTLPRSFTMMQVKVALVQRLGRGSVHKVQLLRSRSKEQGERYEAECQEEGSQMRFEVCQDNEKLSSLTETRSQAQEQSQAQIQIHVVGVRPRHAVKEALNPDEEAERQARRRARKEAKRKIEQQLLQEQQTTPEQETRHAQAQGQGQGHGQETGHWHGEGQPDPAPVLAAAKAVDLEGRHPAQAQVQGQVQVPLQVQEEQGKREGELKDEDAETLAQQEAERKARKKAKREQRKAERVSKEKEEAERLAREDAAWAAEQTQGEEGQREREQACERERTGAGQCQEEEEAEVARRAREESEIKKALKRMKREAKSQAKKLGEETAKARPPENEESQQQLLPDNEELKTETEVQAEAQAHEGHPEDLLEGLEQESPLPTCDDRTKAKPEPDLNNMETASVASTEAEPEGPLEETDEDPKGLAATAEALPEDPPEAPLEDVPVPRPEGVPGALPQAMPGALPGALLQALLPHTADKETVVSEEADMDDIKDFITEPELPAAENQDQSQRSSQRQLRAGRRSGPRLSLQPHEVLYLLHDLKTLVLEEAFDMGVDYLEGLRQHKGWNEDMVLRGKAKLLSLAWKPALQKWGFRRPSAMLTAVQAHEQRLDIWKAARQIEQHLQLGPGDIFGLKGAGATDDEPELNTPEDGVAGKTSSGDEEAGQNAGQAGSGDEGAGQKHEFKAASLIMDPLIISDPYAEDQNVMRGGVLSEALLTPSPIEDFCVISEEENQGGCEGEGEEDEDEVFFEDLRIRTRSGSKRRSRMGNVQSDSSGEDKVKEGEQDEDENRAREEAYEAAKVIYLKAMSSLSPQAQDQVAQSGEVLLESASQLDEHLPSARLTREGNLAGRATVQSAGRAGAEAVGEEVDTTSGTDEEGGNGGPSKHWPAHTPAVIRNRLNIDKVAKSELQTGQKRAFRTPRRLLKQSWIQGQGQDQGQGENVGASPSRAPRRFRITCPSSSGGTDDSTVKACDFVFPELLGALGVQPGASLSELLNAMREEALRRLADEGTETEIISDSEAEALVPVSVQHAITGEEVHLMVPAAGTVADVLQCLATVLGRQEIRHKGRLVRPVSEHALASCRDTDRLDALGPTALDGRRELLLLGVEMAVGPSLQARKLLVVVVPETATTWQKRVLEAVLQGLGAGLGTGAGVGRLMQQVHWAETTPEPNPEAIPQERRGGMLWLLGAHPVAVPLREVSASSLAQGQAPAVAAVPAVERPGPSAETWAGVGTVAGAVGPEFISIADDRPRCPETEFYIGDLEQETSCLPPSVEELSELLLALQRLLAHEQARAALDLETQGHAQAQTRQSSQQRRLQLPLPLQGAFLQQAPGSLQALFSLACVHAHLPGMLEAAAPVERALHLEPGTLLDSVEVKVTVQQDAALYDLRGPCDLHVQVPRAAAASQVREAVLRCAGHTAPQDVDLNVDFCLATLQGEVLADDVGLGDCRELLGVVGTSLESSRDTIEVQVEAKKGQAASQLGGALSL